MKSITTRAVITAVVVTAICQPMIWAANQKCHKYYSDTSKGPDGWDKSDCTMVRDGGYYVCQNNCKKWVFGEGVLCYYCVGSYHSDKNCTTVPRTMAATKYTAGCNGSNFVNAPGTCGCLYPTPSQEPTTHSCPNLGSGQQDPCGGW
jgi:hypothetical protein